MIARTLDADFEPAFSTTTLAAAGTEILYAGLFAGALAFTLQAVGQQHAAPAPAAVLLSSEALFAAIAGAILLGERLDVMGYAGCALLFGAISVAAWLSGRAEERAALT